MQNKRQKTLIYIFIIVLAAAAIWFFVFLGDSQKEKIIEQTQGIFPFGKVNLGNLVTNRNQDLPDLTENEQESEASQEEDLPIDAPRLRQISSFPTGGYVPLIRIEEEEVEDISTDADGNSIVGTKKVEVENTYIRYTEIDDGSVYETQVEAESLEERLLTHNIVPNAERVFFSPDGKRSLFQYWNKDEHAIETYIGRIEKESLRIEPCPFVIDSQVKLGDSNDTVFALHQFLNRNPQTRIANTGLNAPGNEGDTASEATITAIKNFQSLHGLEIDGVLGKGTRTAMMEVCEEQQTILAENEFNKKETTHTISGFFLAQNIESVAVDPQGKYFFYLEHTQEGSLGILRDLTTDSTQTIFSSPFGEWKARWESPNLINLNTKASYLSDGFEYQLATDTGKLSKGIAERKALLTLPNHDGSKTLIFSVNNEIHTSIYDHEKKQEEILSFQTFIEKCLWAHDNIRLFCAVPENFSYRNEYPDTWYQGLELYSDSLWEINTETGEETRLSDLPAEYGQNLDIHTLMSDPKDRYLFFKDKGSETLWSYRLEL